MEAHAAPPPHEAFADLLASAVHDIKNSLGLVLNSAEHIADTVVVAREDHEALVMLQHEARRVNSDLMNLLGLYKLERGAALVAPDVVDCAELMAELVAWNMPLLACRGIMLDVEECAAAEGYFDRLLVVGVLNSVLNNTFRHAQRRVSIGCAVHEGYTIFTVQDDGDGYPEAILHSDLSTPFVGATRGSTGLGLYFARRVAELHRHRDRCGRVELSNRAGSCFQLFLP
ncbi:MAG: HAMP domain-containing histidine kinase [Acidobacteria bacterium]|nr:HAMP domain-containing histidine kinase [Acidobacteriota bacterium]